MKTKEKTVQEIHKEGQRKRSPIYQNWLKVKHFVTVVSKLSASALIMFCGGYAIYKGYYSTYMLSHVALTVAGVFSGVYGLSLLWKAVEEQ